MKLHMVKREVIFILLMAFMFMPVMKVSAADTVTVELPLNGSEVEQEFGHSGNWTFTAPDDGTITVTLKSYQGSMDGSIAKKAGASTYSLWLGSFGTIEAGTSCASVTASVHVNKGGEYCIKLYHYGDTTAKAAVSAAFVADQKVTAIQLDKSQLVVALDDNADLTATVYPADAVNQTLEWTSSDSQIVSVRKDGSIWARKIGQATITAKSTDGGNVTASCIVTVVPAKIDDVEQDKENTTRSRVSIYWGQVEGADGYRIYKYNSSKKKYVLYKDTKDNDVDILRMSAEKSCKVKVAAYVKFGNEKYEGELSKTVTAWTAPKKVSATKITSIKRYSGNALFNYIKVTWKKVKGATGYKIYAKYSGSYKLLGTTKKTSVNLYTGRGYSYQIKVVAYRNKHGMTTMAKASPVKTYKSN